MSRVEQRIRNTDYGRAVDPLSVTGYVEAPLAYDAVWALALALNKSQTRSAAGYRVSHFVVVIIIIIRTTAATLLCSGLAAECLAAISGFDVYSQLAISVIRTDVNKTKGHHKVNVKAERFKTMAKTEAARKGPK